MINPEDIEIYDSTIGFNMGKQFSLEILSSKREKLELIKQQIISNDIIVDRLKELSKEHKFICVCNGHCCDNHELQLETILGDKK